MESLPLGQQADLMKETNDAEERINPVVKIYDEDGVVRRVRKHDKAVERVKSFIRPDETLEEARDRLIEELRDETELQLDRAPRAPERHDLTPKSS